MNKDFEVIEYTVAQNNDWIGFHSSYLGGILGGIISGSLTLGGVYLTIKNQEDKEYKKELSVRFLYNKRIISELINPIMVKHPLESYLQDLNSVDKLEVEGYIDVSLKNKEDHLKYASFIGVEYFRKLDSYITNYEKLKFHLNYIDNPRLMEYSIEEINKIYPEIESLYNQLGELHENLKQEIEDFLETLEKKKKKKKKKKNKGKNAVDKSAAS